MSFWFWVCMIMGISSIALYLVIGIIITVRVYTMNQDHYENEFGPDLRYILLVMVLAWLLGMLYETWQYGWKDEKNYWKI